MLLLYGVEILHHKKADIAGITVHRHNETVRTRQRDKRQQKQKKKEAESWQQAAVCNSERRVKALSIFWVLF